MPDIGKLAIVHHSAPNVGIPLTLIVNLDVQLKTTENVGAHTDLYTANLAQILGCCRRWFDFLLIIETQ